MESWLTECTVLALALFSMDLTSHISIRLIKTKHIIQRHLYIFASLQLRHAKENGRALSEVSNYEEKMEVLWRKIKGYVEFHDWGNWGMICYTCSSFIHRLDECILNLMITQWFSVRNLPFKIENKYLKLFFFNYMECNLFCTLNISSNNWNQKLCPPIIIQNAFTWI